MFAIPHSWLWKMEDDWRVLEWGIEVSYIIATECTIKYYFLNEDNKDHSVTLKLMCCNDG